MRGYTIKVFLFDTSLLRRNLLESPLGISHFSYPSLFKQWKPFSVFAKPDINSRGVGRIRDSYENPRRSQPLQCLYQALQIRKKVFYCFYKLTFPRKNPKLFVMALIKRGNHTSHAESVIVLQKRCFPKYGFFSLKISA